MRRTAKASQGHGKIATPHAQKNKPKCPLHFHQMEFNTDRMLWQCPEFGCQMVAHPKDEAGGKAPVAIKPPFELLIVDDSAAPDEETYIIRPANSRTFIDVTSLMDNFTSQGKGAMLSLYFDSVVVVDENGNPK